MDLFAVNVLVGLLSAAVMMAAIIYILTYVVGSFSKSGVMSPKFVLSSLFYFFGSTIPLLMGSEWLSDLARVPIDGTPFYLNIGASSLALAALLYICCGFLTAFMYLRGRYREISRALEFKLFEH